MRYARIPATLAFLASLFMGASWAADPPASPIRLPVIVAGSQPPKPMPADATVKLTPDVSYVIQAEVECLLFPSPDGAIEITKKVGPVELRGVFVGGTGKKEWKKFDAKFVYVVDAVKDGRDELIVVPVGAKSEADAKRVTFQVGQLPIPPPDDPKPDDPVVPLASANPFGSVSGLHVLMVFDGKETESQNGVIYGAAIREYLNAKANGGKSYRIWPIAVDASGDVKVWQDAFAKAKSGGHRILIGNGTKGYSGSLPANVDEAMKLIKQFGG